MDTIKLQLIDELYLNDHYHLSNDDICYFILSYTPNVGYKHSQENSLILNLKKDMSKKGKSDWIYKCRAIDMCASFLRLIDIKNVISSEITIVPIPPSKTRTDPEYDDRLIQILNKAFNKDVDIRELLIQKNSTECYHTGSTKRIIKEIEDNYEIDLTLAKDIKKNIIIFDDIITSGAHFKAAQNILKKHFPDSNTYGLFIARSVHNNNPFVDFNIFQL